mmetsp:Transcript_51558/g.103543  ORF Transcript_51558/g.103543 Transcript_51558/m.103543 type:complete len:382 (+) Transcript_51558:147-1292(+)
MIPASVSLAVSMLSIVALGDIPAGKPWGNYSGDPSNSALHACTPSDWKHGRWVHGAKRCGLESVYKYPFKEVTKMTAPPGPHPWADWCFHPAFCEPELFSIESFCSKLSGRGLLLVGDSQTEAFYTVIVHQLGLERGKDYLGRNNFFNVSEHMKVCEGMGGGRLAFTKDSYPLMKPCQNTSAKYRLPYLNVPDWHHFAHLFELLVMNQGAHPVVPLEYKAGVNATAFWLKENYSGFFFFRTTPPGHRGVTITSSVDTQLLLTDPDWPHKDQIPEHYHWDLFPELDAFAVATFNKILQNRFCPLHVAAMTYLRRDGHRLKQRKGGYDELHYYFPSVYDSWIHVFFNFIPTEPMQSLYLSQIMKNTRIEQRNNSRAEGPPQPR